MFFHIDESGNTGNNLFDENQPRLSYGLISSTTNVDVRCVKEHQDIQKIIGCGAIHANKLGMKGLVEIAPLLIKIQKKIKFDFDYYYIEKLDYALLNFFDAVFDSGLNSAMPHDLYWTPLRYLLILKIDNLFDKELLRKSWKLLASKKIENNDEIVSLFTEVKSQASQSCLDAQSKKVIIDALNFGISNPHVFNVRCDDQEIISPNELNVRRDAQEISSPNSICFQFIITAIARRTREKRRNSVSSIVVDKQKQFNKIQDFTHDNFVKLSEAINNLSPEEKQRYLNHPLHAHYEHEDIIRKGLTDRGLTFLKSADSIGLQIVDVYLWISNKCMSGAKLPPELLELWSLFSHGAWTDNISLKGMANRYEEFERGRLPNNR